MDLDGFPRRMTRIEDDVKNIYAILGRMGADGGEQLTTQQRVAKANGEPDHVVEALAPRDGKHGKSWGPTKEEFDSILDQVRSLTEQVQTLSTASTEVASLREDLNRHASEYAKSRETPHDQQVQEHVAETEALHAKPAVDGAREKMAADTSAPAAATDVGSNGRPLAAPTDGAVHGTLDLSITDDRTQSRPPQTPVGDGGNRPESQFAGGEAGTGLRADGPRKTDPEA